MNDSELLELAAKAAGKHRNAWDYEWLRSLGHMVTRKNMWNPLFDDGEALRLAAMLRLHIKPGKHKGDGCTVESNRDGIAGCTAWREDEAQQMRCAIVCVAAEIGKSML